MNIIFAFGSIIWTIFIIGVHFQRTKNISPISLTNYFLYLYIVFIHIGTIILLLKLDPISLYDLNMGNTDTIFTIFIYSNLFIGLFVLAIFSFDSIKNFKYNKKNYDVKIFSISLIYSENKIRKLAALFFVISLVGFILYARTLNSLPIVQLLYGKVENIVLLRQIAVGDLYKGKFWVYKLLYYDFLIFAHLLIFVVHTIHHKTRKKDYLYYIVSFWLFFILVFDGEKAPLLLYSIFLFFLYSFLKGKKLNIKFIATLLLLFIIVVIWIFVSYKYFMGRTFYLEILGESVHRLFTGQLQGLYSIIEKFNKDPFLYGRSFPPFLVKFFGGEFYNLDSQNKFYIHYLGKSFNLKFIGLAPTVYWGEIFANFGTIVMILSMFLVPFLLRAIEYMFLSKINKNIINFTLFCYIILRYSNLALGRFSPYLVDFNLFAIILSLFILKKIIFIK